SSGLVQCGEYSNQVLSDGKCRLVATLPQLDEQRCPDLFRCSDEVSYWLHQNEERKQQIMELQETVSEVQEELRNHRHRIKALELQHDDAGTQNSSLEHRVHELEQRYSEANTLLHIHASLIYDMQAQLHNLSLQLEKAHRTPLCTPSSGTRPHRGQEEARHPEVTRVQNCPVDCASMYYNGIRRSGVYTIVPSIRGMPTEVFCDMDTEGGGWTVIQRRQDGTVNFNRSWKEYKMGFGDLHGEFWLGNDHIHEITSQGDYSLRIDLEDWNNKQKYARYVSFSIEEEANHYRLHVNGFSGTVEDSFAWYHNKRSFSTPDTGNICAEISHGGWWYHQCFFANLNGVYYKGGRYNAKSRNLLGPDGVVWYSWKNSDYYSLKKVRMMVRPRNFRPRLSP
uniref:Si:ch211-203k16.3 n=1 Tax=Latimeria chalumnae TaxID=7897 RepID=H3ASL3_LATCH